MATFDKELALKINNLQIPNRIRFSPDGTKIAYTATLAWGQRIGKHALSTIWLASTDQPGSARKLTSGSSNDSEPTWLPDGSGIVFLSDRADPGKSSALWLLRLDGGDATAITSTENVQSITHFSVSPDGKTVAYSSADEKSDERKKQDENGEAAPPDVWGQDLTYSRLRLVDLASKETKQLVGGDRHISRMDWSPDGKHIVIRSTKNLELDEHMRTGVTISSVSVASASVRDLRVVMNDPGSLTWAPDGKVYFISGYTTKTSCCGQALYSLNPADSNPEPVRVAFGVEDDIRDLTVSGGKLVALCLSRLSTVIREVDGPIITTKDTRIDAWDVYFDVANGGQPVLAAALSDINTPYEVFTIKQGQEDGIKLSNHGESLQGKSFGSCTILNSQSSDGKEELDALFLVPSTAKVDANGKPEQPLPTFVMIHGGPTYRDEISFDAAPFNWPSYILSQGYGVLLPQYRGTSGRGEAFAAYSRSGVGDFDYADVISMTDHAIKSGFADPKKLLAGGWSQGGYLSYLCSVRNGLHGLGWQFNAIIAGAGVSYWDSMALESDIGADVEPEMVCGQSPWTVSKDCTNARKGSAIYEVAHAVEESRRLGKVVIPPMLILHGSIDARVPLPQGEGFHRALRAHGLPQEFVVYPDSGHIPTAQRYWVDMLERLGRWCHNYIGQGKGGDIS